MQVKFSVLFSRFRCALLLMLLLLGLAAISGCSTGGTSTTVSGQTVVTEFGSLSGYYDSSAYVFKGIPYAAPPVGDLRWRAPEDPTPWEGVRDATKPASVCTQEIYTQQWVSSASSSLAGGGDASPSSYIGSEDCLYLDVYTPQVTKPNLPVFVWIHGGANNFGGATSYDARRLASRENMVVVVIQYRLAPLGWLSNYAWLDGSEDPWDASGNYGTLDQIKALTWVQNNIAAFGGNPARVTIGGQSAGGNATINLTLSNLTYGLFNQAAAFSPAMALNSLDPNYSTAGTLSDYMIDWLLQDDATFPLGDWSDADFYRVNTMNPTSIKSYLRSKPAWKILEACIEANLYLNNQGIMPAHSPYMDGIVLPNETWVNAIYDGYFHGVPLLIGNTEYEDKAFMPLLYQVAEGFGLPSTATPLGWLNLLYGVLIPFPTPYALTDVLSPINPSPNDQYLYDTSGLLASEMWKANYTDAVTVAIQNYTSNNSTIFSYYFQWNGGGDPAVANFQFIYGAGHATDVPFWFGGYDQDALGFSFTAANRPGRVLLMNAMMDSLGNFVYSGDPNSGPAVLPTDWPTWYQWYVGDPELLTLDANLNSIVWNTGIPYYDVYGWSGEFIAGNILSDESTYLPGFYAALPTYFP